MDPLLHLADELCAHIFSFLDPKDLGTVSEVSHAYHAFANEELLWKLLCARHFAIRKKNPQIASWKELYKTRIPLLKELKAMHLSSSDINTEVVILDSPYTLRYIGHDSESGDTVGAAQASKKLQLVPFGDACIHSYFEVSIDDAGESGYIAVGVGLDRFPQSRGQPGWRTGSFGYHGDDGRLYTGGGWGPQWGPTFTTGDVIGCGVNFKTKELFYTKNGKLLGTYSKPIDNLHSLFAIVGMHSFNEKVTVNFGAKPFLFDIASYAQDAPVDDSEFVKLTSAAIMATKDWTEREDENPFDYMIGRIDAGEADKDAEFVSHVRDIVSSMNIPDVDNLTCEEMFGMVRRLYDYMEQNRQEKKEWDALPKEQRPELNRMEYSGLQRDFSMLANRSLPDTHPAIKNCVDELTTGESAEDMFPEWTAEELAKLPFSFKRAMAINQIGRLLVQYEKAVALRDLTILRNSELTNENARVMRVLRSNTAEVVTRFELTQEQVVALGNNLQELREKCMQLLQETVTAAEAAEKHFIRYKTGQKRKKEDESAMKDVGEDGDDDEDEGGSDNQGNEGGASGCRPS